MKPLSIVSHFHPPAMGAVVANIPQEKKKRFHWERAFQKVLTLPKSGK